MQYHLDHLRSSSRVHRSLWLSPQPTCGAPRPGTNLIGGVTTRRPRVPVAASCAASSGKRRAGLPLHARTPGSCVSATMRSFSSTPQRRRRYRPPMISTMPFNIALNSTLQSALRSTAGTSVGVREGGADQTLNIGDARGSANKVLIHDARQEDRHQFLVSTASALPGSPWRRTRASKPKVLKTDRRVWMSVRYRQTGVDGASATARWPSPFEDTRTSHSTG